MHFNNVYFIIKNNVCQQEKYEAAFLFDLFLDLSGLDILGQLPHALHELQLGHWHGQIEDGVGDPALVLAVHEPHELAGVVVNGNGDLGTGSVPSSASK